MAGKPKIWSRIWASIKRHPVRTVVLSPIGFWLFWNFVDWVFSDWLSGHLWRPMSEAIIRWANHPIWYVGLIVLLWTGAGALVLFGLWLIDKSSTVAWLRARRKGPQQEELDRLKAELEATKKKLQDAQDQNEHNEWFWNWRVRPPAVLPLEASEKREAAIEIARLEPKILRNLAEGIKGITEELLQPLHEMSSDSFLWTAGKYINDGMVLPIRRLLALLRDPKERDARQVFKAFYEQYKELREWIVQSAAYYEKPLTDFKAYKAWHDADTAFFSEVEEFPSIHAMAELSQFVQQEKLGGYPKEFPSGFTEKEQELDLVLRQRSDSETEFLMLLRPDAPAFGEPGTLMLANKVYRAGQELAKRGVFAFRELREGDVITDLFTVPNYVAPILKRHLFPESEMRMEVRLRLDRVWSGVG